MARAWLYQDTKQKQKLGDKCKWSVGWYDPEGKRRSKQIGSKSLAQKFCRNVEGQLASGTYESTTRKSWKEFRAELEARTISMMAEGTKRETLTALAHFERIMKPKRVTTIKTQHVDDYKANRSREKSKRRKGLLVSPATVNKELRHLKAVFRQAHDWGYLHKPPKVMMLREPKKLPRFVPVNEFASIYAACDAAKRPRGLPYSPADWWRALVIFAYMTGWRIGEPLALRRQDLDLEKQTAITRHADNKGRRDEIVPLHDVVVDHLRKVASFEPMVFPWPHHRRTLDVEFQDIQKEAGIWLDCPDASNKDHECTDACHLYGFHDLRRAFATANAETLSASELQALMRHQSFQTTQRYINMARALNRTADKLHVPEFLRVASG